MDGHSPAPPQPRQRHGPQGGGQPQLTHEEQISHQLAAKDHERADTARFAIILPTSEPNRPPQSRRSRLKGTFRRVAENPYLPLYRRASRPPSPAPAPRDNRQAARTGNRVQTSGEVNIDNAIGQPYVIYEGLTLDTVFMNGLDGDAVGPVKVLVSNPVYSHDHQHVLIPNGTLLGEARKIGAAGFAQQRRLRSPSTG